MNYDRTLAFNLKGEDPTYEVGNSRFKNKISQKKEIIIIIIIVSLGKERNRHSKNKKRIRWENSFCYFEIEHARAKN
jgi:hypothetical protein